MLGLTWWVVQEGVHMFDLVEPLANLLLFQSYWPVSLVVGVEQVDVIHLLCHSCSQMHHVDLLEVVAEALCDQEAQEQVEQHDQALLG